MRKRHHCAIADVLKERDDDGIEFRRSLAVHRLAWHTPGGRQRLSLSERALGGPSLADKVSLGPMPHDATVATDSGSR